MYIDAHSHWSDLRLSQAKDSIKAQLLQAEKLKITYFMQAGVDPEDWQRQFSLQKKFPENFGLCFGLHPYYVADIFKSGLITKVEDSLDQLSQILPLAIALGEAGLDFREKVLGTIAVEKAMAFQIEAFENQIQLAHAFKKPLVLHIVRAHEKAIEVLRMWKQEKAYSGLVHAFTGSFETAQLYIELGFLISVGTAVTFAKNHKLHKCVQRLPIESFVIETDSPDQPPEGQQGLNLPENLIKVAEKIAELRGLSAEKVLEITTDNFKRVFSPKVFS